MAVVSKFKNALAAGIGNSFVPVYTAPAGKDSYAIELDISDPNNTGVQVSARLHDVSAATICYIVKGAPVPVGSSLQIIDGQKIVLEEGDFIDVICESPGQVVDAIMSIVEDVNN